MHVVIANDQERENLFAEVHVDGQPHAEVIFDDEKGRYLVTLFCGDESEWRTYDLLELLESLKAARSALVERGYPAAS